MVTNIVMTTWDRQAAVCATILFSLARTDCPVLIQYGISGAFKKDRNVGNRQLKMTLLNILFATFLSTRGAYLAGWDHIFTCKIEQNRKTEDLSILSSRLLFLKFGLAFWDSCGYRTTVWQVTNLVTLYFRWE